MTDSSTPGIKTVLHPVADLAAAKRVYAALLGVPAQTDKSITSASKPAGQHFGLAPGAGPPGMTSPVANWHVPDLEAKLAEVTAAGTPLEGARARRPRAASGPRSAAPRSRPSGSTHQISQRGNVQ